MIVHAFTALSTRAEHLTFINEHTNATQKKTLIIPFEHTKRESCNCRFVSLLVDDCMQKIHMSCATLSFFALECRLSNCHSHCHCQTPAEISSLIWSSQLRNLSQINTETKVKSLPNSFKSSCHSLPSAVHHIKVRASQCVATVPVKCV